MIYKIKKELIISFRINLKTEFEFLAVKNWHFQKFKNNKHLQQKYAFRFKS